MQKSNWLRIGFVSALALAGATTAIACGGDDEVEPGVDSGVSSSSSSGDNDTDGAASSSGNGGSSSGGSSGAAPVPAALAVVHGFNNLGAVKICYALSKTAVPEVGAGLSAIRPLPDSAGGLIPGSGGILPGTGLVLADYNIRPYLIKVTSIGANGQLQCPELIGAEATVQPALVEGTDWFALEPITIGQLKNESTFVLVARESGTAAGKPAAALFELDTADVAADKVGIQFVHGSTYFGPLTGGTDVAPFLDRPGDDADAGDAGDAGDDPPAGRTFEFVTGSDNTTKTAPFAAISALKLTDPIVTAATTAFGIQVGTGNITILNTTGLNSLGDLVPVATWAGLSDPNKIQGDGADSLYFKSGNGFTFVLVGDPGPSNAANFPPGVPAEVVEAYSKPHFLVFPNKPIVPGL